MKERIKKQFSDAARKANATRKARKEFRKTYPETAHIAEMLLKGTTGTCDSKEAAVLANLNRKGKYRDMALACNF